MVASNKFTPISWKSRLMLCGCTISLATAACIGLRPSISTRLSTTHHWRVFCRSTLSHTLLLPRQVSLQTTSNLSSTSRSLPTRTNHLPGGTAIDADGNVYVSGLDRQEILRISPNGTMSVFIRDERLLWVDAMWIDSKQKLWMPAAQLNRGTPFNNGTSFVQKPLYIFTVDLGVGPSAIDHA